MRQNQGMQMLVTVLALATAVGCKNAKPAAADVDGVRKPVTGSGALVADSARVTSAAVDGGPADGPAVPVVDAQPKPQTQSGRKPDFNAYVLKAVDSIYERHKAEGYSAGAYFTHDLDYKQSGAIRASKHKPATMCVAAVSEVIIEAIDQYAQQTGDTTVFERLPARSWNGATAKDLRPYIFMFDTVKSNGTPDALHQFGLGEEVPFKDLVPGDFIGLNRDNGTGHAVVFLGFLNATGGIEAAFDPHKVVGFKYFSSQGKNRPDAGFGFRWAFFGACPAWHEADKPRDCGIVRSDSQRILNTGYMLDPHEWTIEAATGALERRALEKAITRHLGRPPGPHDLERMSEEQRRAFDIEARQELEKVIPEVSALKFDGATSDD